MEPKISIIIPVYHAENYLPKCLDSVLRAKLEELEILVVDDGSGSECEQIVQGYMKCDSRVKYIRHAQNKGLFEARYTGIQHARGEYIAHLDPDDWVDEEVYKLAYEKAYSTDAAVVMFNVEQCDEKDNRWIEPRNVLKSFDDKSGWIILEYILNTVSNEWIWHVSWNKLIKNSVAKRLLPLFEKRKHLVMYEDLLWSIALFLAVGQNGKCAAIEHCGLTYYRHEASITKRDSTKVYAKKMQDILYVFSQIKRLLKQYHLYNSLKKSYLATKVNVFRMYWIKMPKLYLLKQPFAYFIVKSFLIKNKNLYVDQVEQDKVTMIDAAEKLLTQALNHGKQKVCIYGTGELGMLIFRKLRKHGVQVNAFVLSQVSEEALFNGQKVITVEEAIENGEEFFVIASLGSALAIKKTLIGHAEKLNHKIKYVGIF